MKRLKRVASFETPSEFLSAWCNDHLSVDVESIQKIANENQDCIYSGEAFRYIELNVDYEDKEQSELIEESRMNINSIIESSSFSSSQRGVTYFITTDYREFGVIIKSSVRGLDIKALANKYRDEITHSHIFEYTNMEDEIVTLEEVSNFEVAALVIEEEIEWL